MPSIISVITEAVLLQAATPTNKVEPESANLLLSNQALWGIILVFSIVLVSLIIAYQSRNTAYRVAKLQQERLKALNAKLKSQSEELAQTNRAKDQLISVISHDLRAPLASLDSCLEIMITEDLSSEEKDELTRDLQKETYNTLKTLDDLLAWARLQQDGKVKKEEFDIISLLREVINLYLPVARHKEVELVLKADEERLPVVADPNQIRTVIRNLLSNAIKFTPLKGRVTLSGSQQNGKAEISIQDEGKGISREELEKIMDPETYYSSQGTAGENGTGVGLMLSFEFINRHDSQLKLSPALPQGTRASFQLPVSAVKTSSAKSA